MPTASSATAFGCLALGLADLLYLNLAAAPAMFEEGPGAARSPAAVLEPELTAPAPTASAYAGPAVPTHVAPTPIMSTTASSEPVAVAAAATTVPTRKLPRRAARRARPARTWSLTVSFARDRDDLTERARARLDRAAARLIADPSAIARIDGHADRVGDGVHDRELSRRRAARVADHLAALGVDRRRLIVRGLGARRARGPEADAAPHRRNRRVQVRVAGGADVPALRPEEEAP